MINDLRVIGIFNKLVSLKLNLKVEPLEGKNFSIFRGRFDFYSDFAAARIIEFPIPPPTRTVVWNIFVCQIASSRGGEGKVKETVGNAREKNVSRIYWSATIRDICSRFMHISSLRRTKIMYISR